MNAYVVPQPETQDFGPSGPDVNGFGYGDFSTSRLSGLSITNLGATLADIAPTSRTVSAGGGVGGTLELTRPLELQNGRRLFVSGNIDYHSSKTSFGSTPELKSTGVHNGASESDTIGLSSSVSVRQGLSYIVGSFNYDWNWGSTQLGDISRSRFSGDGYGVDLQLGHYLPLYNGLVHVKNSAGQDSWVGDNAVLLDGRIHVGYQSHVIGGSTDTLGVTVGDTTLENGTVGLGLRLINVVPKNDALWFGYVGAKWDQDFETDYRTEIPAQAGLAADTLIFGKASTHWGGELGLNVVMSNGLLIGAQGFYTASANEESIGGGLNLRIPLQ